MELIIGGAYQGQLDYGKTIHPRILWIDGKSCTEEELWQCQGVYDFHEWIRRGLKEGKDLENFAERLWKNNPDIIIVSNEVGYGVVPVDAFDRAYREAVGRICTKLAAKAVRVHRVVCGIGTVIKDA